MLPAKQLRLSPPVPQCEGLYTHPWSRGTGCIIASSPSKANKRDTQEKRRAVRTAPGKDKYRKGTLNIGTSELPRGRGTCRKAIRMPAPRRCPDTPAGTRVSPFLESPLGKTALGGEKALHSSSAFQNRPVLPELLLTWAEMHFYIKNRSKTAHMDTSGQPGFFPSLKCCLGGVRVREEGAFPPDPVRPGPS